MVDNDLVKNVQSTFSLFGLILSRKIGIALAKQLSNISSEERDAWLEKVVQHIVTQNLKEPHVNAEHIKQAVQECFGSNTAICSETILNVISAFNFPKVVFDTWKRKFVVEDVDHGLYAEAKEKTQIFIDRFNLIWYRTTRHSNPDATEVNSRKIDKIIPIEHVLSNATKGLVCIMGYLTQFERGQYYLEDCDSHIKIDLKKEDFITEGCIVIATGIYEDKTFLANDILLPPPESSAYSRIDFGNSNTFGGTSQTSLKLSEKLQLHEQANQDGMIVFISDFWIDSAIVLDRFQKMLGGYSNYPPIAFIFCGNFLSSSINTKSKDKFKLGMQQLADMIKQYPEICTNSKFIFVPGPLDFGAPQILPRNPLPESLTQEFREAVPGAIFATNPCRIQYCTKEIVVFREDLLTKLQQNAVHVPSTGKLHEHLARTIIGQSYLAPVNLPVLPVYWKHSTALQLYPIPDVIVIAEDYEGYSCKYSDCRIVNPGIFSKDNFSFKVYVPASDMIEDCEIPPEEEI